MRTLLVILVGLSILFSACTTSDDTQVDDNSLPADLLFKTITGNMGLYTTLMRVDAQTAQISTFYVDEGVYIRPISWSPNGDLLAILRESSLTSDYMELCLLTREGVLQSCFEDKIVSYDFGDRGSNYMTTWSEDGHYIYFVTDYAQFFMTYTNPDGTWAASLVKADVSTGQTQQVLYQTQTVAHRPPSEVYWTEDLHYLLVREWNSTTIDLWQNTEIALPQELSSQGHLLYCPKFSPQGQYLIAQASLNDALTEWAVVTPEGQIVQTMGSDRLQQAGIAEMECPVWQSDETSFYFIGHLQDDSFSLFKYILANDTLVNLRQLYPPNPQDPAFPSAIPHMPMRLASDNATLAITFWANSQTHIGVLGPTNQWITYGEDADQILVGANPIWFPVADSD